MMWGTPGCIGVIHVMTQYFCEAHDSNQATSKPVDLTQSGFLLTHPAQGVIYLFIFNF